MLPPRITAKQMFVLGIILMIASAVISFFVVPYVYATQWSFAFTDIVRGVVPFVLTLMMTAGALFFVGSFIVRAIQPEHAPEQLSEQKPFDAGSTRAQ